MKANKKILAIVAIIALVAILGVCLVACNADSYAKKLEKAGYTVQKLEAEKDEDGHAIEWTVNASKKGEGLLGVVDGDTVSVTKFKSEDDAKEAEELAKAFWGEKGVYRSGKIVISGTEQGVKDAK